MIRRVEEILYQEHDRLLLWSPVLFALGIGGYFSLPYEPSLYVGAIFCSSTLLLLLIFWRNFVVRMLLLALLLMACGMTVATIRTMRLATPVLEKDISPRMITGLVTDVRHYNNGKLHIILKNPNIFISNNKEMRLRKIRIKVNTFDELPYPGDRITIRAGMLKSPAPVMPDGYDYGRQIWFQGIGALGYGIGKPEIIFKAANERGLSTQKRLILSEKIRASIEGDAGGLAAALITGIRDGISQEVSDDMRNSGLAHLLAISGLHMGLLCGAAFFFSRFLLSRSEYLALHYPLKKWAAVIAIGAGVVYVYLSGGSIPTVRAFIMATVLFLGVLTDRKAISLRLVAIAAMIILILTPEALLSVSFQMSFAAVVALIAFYEKMDGGGVILWGRGQEKKFRWLRSAGFYVGTIFLTTIIAEISIGPFALFHFNKLVQYGLVANLIVMPVMAIWVMPCVVAYLILAPLGLGILALYPMSYGLEIIIYVADVISHAQGAYRLVPSFDFLSLVIMVMGALWYIIWKTAWKKIGIIVVMVGVISAFLSTRPDILIDNSGRLIGIKDAEGKISLSGLRGGRITRKQWAKSFGQKKAKKWTDREENNAGEAWMSCDDMSCLYRPIYQKSALSTEDISERKNRPDILVALVKNELALAEDCKNAQMVISLVPVKVPCPSAALVIDKGDFYHNGGYAIWLPKNSGEVIKVKTVVESRGERPWSPTR